jgi:hypothetical protein
MEHALSANPEKEVGMRKLLEAKDCFVRAALASPAPKLPAYQQRVVDEVAELDDRLNKLQTFLRRDPPVPMPGEALALLVKQAALMQELSDVLHRRISQFPKEGQ